MFGKMPKLQCTIHMMYLVLHGLNIQDVTIRIVALQAGSWNDSTISIVMGCSDETLSPLNSYLAHADSVSSPALGLSLVRNWHQYQLEKQQSIFNCFGTVRLSTSQELLTSVIIDVRLLLCSCWPCQYACLRGDAFLPWR